jgi:hypothetical protein
MVRGAPYVDLDGTGLEVREPFPLSLRETAGVGLELGENKSAGAHEHEIGEAFELLDLAIQEASVRAWNASLHAVPVIGPEGQVAYPD